MYDRKLQHFVKQSSFNLNLKKNPHTINPGECVGWMESYYSVNGNVNWYSHYGEQYEGSLKS